MKKLASGAELGLAADSCVGAQRYGGNRGTEDMAGIFQGICLLRSMMVVSGDLSLVYLHRRIEVGKVERKYYRCEGVGGSWTS